MVSAWAGLHASYALDTPTGPTIVCVTALLFSASTVASGLRRAA
jgi:zinc transport system permease protein